MLRRLHEYLQDARRRRSGLAVQAWFYMVAFSVFILVALWVLQFALFNTFYLGMRQNDIRRVGRGIVREYSESNFESILREHAFYQNLRILLVDESGWIRGNYDPFGDPFSVAGNVDMPRGDFNRILTEFADDKTQEAWYLAQNSDGEFDRAVYVARVDPSVSGDRFLYVASPIPASDATINVLAMQFGIITVFVLLAGFAVSWLLSRRIARPIVRLTESAKTLVTGSFQSELIDGDYGEISTLSRELESAAVELSRAEHYRQELVANVSHDLKTPLTIIQMYGELIRDVSGEDPVKREAHCQKIIEEAARLTELVNSLLDISKTEAAQSGAKPMRVLDLSALLLETSDRFAGQCEHDGFFFERAITPNARVMGDAESLGQAIYNLIANAVNYTGEDKRVVIKLDIRGGKARVAIRDTGDGIPAEELSHIWERFYKTNSAHKRSVAGTGLGLSIVRKALEAHNAVVGVDSTLGQGSTFWFEMDLVGGGAAA
ncbi:MAG: HAMP domain-containing histidine kinase [Oscillospiraceae bacterium]|jgi:signal transduction histidine kinase|nr:HAMP domain-containing histidine kinase [Oscillospiraceae bacterium]